MSTILILVANDSLGRFLVCGPGGTEMGVIESIAHPEGRMKNRDMLTDSPGRSFDSMGGQRHSMESRQNPHRREEQTFARTLSLRLMTQLEKKPFSGVFLIAPPHLLGLLRKNLPDSLEKKWELTEIPKDFPDWLSDEELFAKVGSELGLK